MSDALLKIMYLNPAPDLFGEDALFAELATKEKGDGTEVHVTSLPRSVGLFSHIEYRSYEAMVTRAIIQAVRAASIEEFDALVIGCFYDTALLDSRELSGGMIITAPCEAAVDVASTLSNRFGVVIGREKGAHQMGRTIDSYGRGSSLTGFYPLGLGVDDFQKDHEETLARMLEAGRIAVEGDHSESLILGAPWRRAFTVVSKKKLACLLSTRPSRRSRALNIFGRLRRSQGWVPSRSWSCEAPPDAELAAIGVSDVAEPFGNRIVVPG